MDQGLEGRNALVTGASKGIGLAIARALAAEGAHVVAGARSASPDLADLVDEGRVVEVHADLSTADGPADLVGAALAFGGLDVLVNNALAPVPPPTGTASRTNPTRAGPAPARRDADGGGPLLPGGDAAPRGRPGGDRHHAR